jgi:hypothetical protein
MSTQTNKLAVFLDTVGRTILGEICNDQSNETYLAISNPVVLHVVPQDQSGKMAVQLLPVFFREFLAAKEEPVIFKYNRSNITETSISTIDFRLNAQYVQMFNPQNTFISPDQNPANQNQTPTNQQSVINLFDEA